MSKFYISAIQMDKTGQHIEWVKTHKVINDKKFDSMGSINSRKFIVELIETGYITFETISKNKNSNTWKTGAEVYIVDKKYITTEPNGTKRDNLGNLPTFELES